MPASEEDIAAIVRRFLPDADDAVVDYLVASVSEATSLEELSESCEGQFEDEDACSKMVEELQAVLGLGAPKATAPRSC